MSAKKTSRKSLGKTPKKDKIPLWKRLQDKQAEVETLEKEFDEMSGQAEDAEPKKNDAFWKPKFDAIPIPDVVGFLPIMEAQFAAHKAKWEASQKKGKTRADEIRKLRKKIQIARTGKSADGTVTRGIGFESLEHLEREVLKKTKLLKKKIHGTDKEPSAIIQSVAMYNYYAAELGRAGAHFVCPGEDFEMTDLARQYYEDNDLRFVSIPVKALDKFLNKVNSGKKMFLKTVPVFVSEIVGNRQSKYGFAMAQGKHFCFKIFFFFF